MQLLLSHALPPIPGARCLSPAELRGQMEERFTWAVSRGHAVSALACEPVGLERFQRQDPGLTPRVLCALALALEPAFRASEAVLDLEDGCFVVLLVGPDPKRMDVACREWVGGAKELRIDGLAAPLRMSLRIGYGVTQPGKRFFLDTLIQVARAGLDIARCRGAGACVHTMLYDILQDRLERERGIRGIAVTADATLAPRATTREPGIEGTAPVIAEARPGVPGQTSQRGSHGGGAPDPKGLLADREHRERELIEALDTQRLENDALRARLHALETRDDRSGVAALGTQETPTVPSEGVEDRLRIDQLERRLAKVTRSLEEAEERLARVWQENEVDSGVASIYRTVRGLAADAPQHSLKAALMHQIFEANLELHERLQFLGRQVHSTETTPGLEPG